MWSHIRQQVFIQSNRSGNVVIAKLSPQSKYLKKGISWPTCYSHEELHDPVDGNEEQQGDSGRGIH